LSIHSEKHVCDQLYSSNAELSLFTRLHREFQPFNKRKILLADIENISNSCPSCHHIQIIGHRLYNVPRPAAWNYETRSRSVKILIKHVMDTFPDIPDLELFLNVHDIVDLPNGLNDAFFNVPIFGITKTNKVRRGLHSDGIVLMPCFTLWSWPEARVGRWSKIFQSILDAGKKMEYEKRVPKLFWRGVEFPKRSWFIKVAKKYPGSMDVGVMKWTRLKNILALTPSDTYKTLEQHCSYKYLLHQEGVTYSSRLKYLLLCGSAVVFNAVEYWEEYWYHLLENDKNIILFEANGNETVLESTLNFLKHQDDKAKDIGSKGRQLVQNYLNEHAVSCYWWKLLHEYAKLIGYKPSLHPDAVHIDDFILGSLP
jgi:protein glucosyltransferase